MTKLKSKKMSKSTFAVIIMAIVMVAMLAFGGTYAYFTSGVGTAFSKSTTAGQIKISEKNGKDVFTASTTLKSDVLPSEPLVTGLAAASIVVKDESTRASYIFFQYSVDVYAHVESWNAEAAIREDLEEVSDGTTTDGYTDTIVTTEISKNLTTSGVFSSNNGLTLTALDGQAGIYYIKTVEDNPTTTEVDESKLNGEYTINLGGNAITIPYTWKNEYQNAKIEVKFSVESIQGTFGDAASAWSALHPQNNG